MKTTLNRMQRGVTLFELMLVLFVAAFIAAAVGTIYVRVNNSYKANATLDLVQQFVANIRGIYAQQGNYNGLSSTNLMTSGLVPKKMCASGTITACSSLIYPFGTASIADVGTGTTFNITLNTVPAAICTDLATRFLPGVKSMAIGGTDVTDTAGILDKCKTGTPNFVLTYD